MKHINVYITEAWSGVKQHTLKSDIKAWCEEMKIRNYTINSKGEIDVDGNVNLGGENFEELPYKFGSVTGWFSVGANKNLKSLKNCPYFVKNSFNCDRCSKLESLVGCPKEVGMNFYCFECKKLFTEEEVQSLCKIKKENILV